MHRYEELEKIYYKKLYLKIFIGFILFIIFIILLFIFLDSTKKPVKSEKKTIQKIKKTLKTKTKNKDINNSNKTLQIKKELKPKQKIKKEQELKFILPNIDFIKEPEKPNQVKKNIREKKQVKKTLPSKSPIVIQQQSPLKEVKITEENISINQLINQFRTNKNYDLAITIAKMYLKQNNLKNAQIWALNANNLNPSKPDSWIIFADIMIKKHNIKKAKEILKVYVDSYGSNDIIEEKLRSINGK